MHEIPNKRPHQVDSSTGEFLYTLYGFLFKANVELRIKQRTFESAADSRNSWRVVSVTQEALNHIMEYKTAKGLQRGHMLSRIDRAAHIFDRESPLTKDELLKYFFEHDTVTLVTKAENAKNGVDHWSLKHPVPEEQDLFTAGSFSIYLRKKKEILWVQEVVAPKAPRA